MAISLGFKSDKTIDSIDYEIYGDPLYLSIFYDYFGIANHFVSVGVREVLQPHLELALKKETKESLAFVSKHFSKYFSEPTDLSLFNKFNPTNLESLKFVFSFVTDLELLVPFFNSWASFLTTHEKIEELQFLLEKATISKQSTAKDHFILALVIKDLKKMKEIWTAEKFASVKQIDQSLSHVSVLKLALRFGQVDMVEWFCEVDPTISLNQEAKDLHNLSKMFDFFLLKLGKQKIQSIFSGDRSYLDMPIFCQKLLKLNDQSMTENSFWMSIRFDDVEALKLIDKDSIASFRKPLGKERGLDGLSHIVGNPKTVNSVKYLLSLPIEWNLVEALKRVRNFEIFELIWNRIDKKQQISLQLDIAKFVLPNAIVLKDVNLVRWAMESNKSLSWKYALKNCSSFALLRMNEFLEQVCKTASQLFISPEENINLENLKTEIVSVIWSDAKEEKISNLEIFKKHGLIDLFQKEIIAEFVSSETEKGTIGASILFFGFGLAANFILPKDETSETQTQKTPLMACMKVRHHFETFQFQHAITLLKFGADPRFQNYPKNDFVLFPKQNFNLVGPSKEDFIYYLVRAGSLISIEQANGNKLLKQYRFW